MILQPAYALLVDGLNVTSTFSPLLLELRLTDVRGAESDTLEVTLDDKDGRLAIPRKGAKISVSIGYGASLTFMGFFTVDQVVVEGGEDDPRKMTISAKAADFRKTIKEHKTRAWKDQTLGGIVSKVASEHGLSGVVSGALKSFRYRYLAQSEESDMHMLARLAKKHGATLKVSNGKLVISPRGAQQSASGQSLQPVLAQGGANVLTYRANLKDRPVFGKVKATWLDRKTGKEKQVVESAPAGGDDVAAILRHPFLTEDDAKDAAQARGRELEREGSSLSLTIVGNPAAQAGAPLVVSRVRSGVDGTWQIDRVEHVISDAGGYTCEIEAKQEPSSSKSGGASTDSDVE